MPSKDGFITIIFTPAAYNLMRQIVAQHLDDCAEKGGDIAVESLLKWIDAAVLREGSR